MHHPDRGTGLEGVKNAISTFQTLTPVDLVQHQHTADSHGRISCAEDHLPGTDRHRHRNQDAGDNLKEVQLTSITSCLSWAYSLTCA